MNISSATSSRPQPGATRRPAAIASAGSVLLGTALILGLPGPVAAAPAVAGNFCSSSADSLRKACRDTAGADFFTTGADCKNLSDSAARSTCYQERQTALADDKALCDAQRGARFTICGALGEDRYDPVIDPANFVDPAAIGTSVAPNPNWILTPGYTRIYNLNGDVITVTVTNKTIVIDGVKCRIVTDVHKQGNFKVEDTQDFVVQDLSGNVWYFGEITTKFVPGELPATAGTFEAGINNAKPGILMKGTLNVGTSYREEWALKDAAEDVARIVSTTSTEHAPAASCAGTCLETENTTGVEPDNVEHKFYQPGIGEVVSFDGDGTDPTTREELVSYHY